MSNITTTEYGEVSNQTILKIFGDEMTYNELKIYANDDTTHLSVEINRNEETQLVRVYLDGKEIMDKKYSIHYSCDMFYYLSELDEELDRRCEICGNDEEVSISCGCDDEKMRVCKKCDIDGENYNGWGHHGCIPCSICKDWIPKDDVVMVESGNFCEDCYEEYGN